ncbi:hypothetical protein D9M71_376430 [compost metagenome]
MRDDAGVDADLRGIHAVQRFQGHLHGLRQSALEQSGGIPEFETQADPPALDVQVAQVAGALQVLAGVGVDDLAKNGFHRSTGNDAHGVSRRKAEQGRRI